MRLFAALQISVCLRGEFCHCIYLAGLEGCEHARPTTLADNWLALGVDTRWQDHSGHVLRCNCPPQRPWLAGRGLTQYARQYRMLQKLGRFAGAEIAQTPGKITGNRPNNLRKLSRRQRRDVRSQKQKGGEI